MFAAELGNWTSYKWRSIFGEKGTTVRASRWIIRDGRTPNIWHDRWLPRPLSFKPITSRPSSATCAQVADLLDHINGRWRETLVRQIFLPCDAKIFLSIPLCDSWPSEKLIWHYNSHGVFTVQSAYHMLMSHARINDGCSCSK